MTSDKPVHRDPEEAKPPTIEEECQAREALMAIGSKVRRPSRELQIRRRLCERIRKLGETSARDAQIRTPGRRPTPSRGL